MDTSFIILVLCKLLSITKPVELRMHTTETKKYSKIAGMCEVRMRKGKIISYVIIVNLPEVIRSEYPLLDVIAHELIHVVQFENSFFDENHHHDNTFQKLCKVLEIEAGKRGIKLGALYNPKTDTD